MGEKKSGAEVIIDVGILAIGLTKNPAADYCLKFIDDAVRGRIKANRLGKDDKSRSGKSDEGVI